MKKRTASAGGGLLLIGGAVMLGWLQPRHGIFGGVLALAQTLACLYGLMFLIGSVLPGDWVWDSQD